MEWNFDLTEPMQTEEEVLVCHHAHGDPTKRMHVQIACYVNQFNEWWTRDNTITVPIVAWMPLPKPPISSSATLAQPGTPPHKLDPTE